MKLMPGQDSAWQSLANRQIDFYASELPSGNPCKLSENIAARDRARQYLMNIQGVDRIYNGILAAAEKTFPSRSAWPISRPPTRKCSAGPAEIRRRL